MQSKILSGLKAPYVAFSRESGHGPVQCAWQGPTERVGLAPCVRDSGEDTTVTTRSHLQYNLMQDFNFWLFTKRQE